ncbi:S8 family serine peptidase [Microcoleus sp. N9_B2]|uniref:S8 family serine peptidase n=1 Tax=unclassified Microcoleus TaxID=2642155 RepID=UPI002FD6CA21
MSELINYNATLNLENEKSNLDAVIGSTNPLVPASDKINSGHSVINSVIANDSATNKDISPTILDLKIEEINNVILPVSSTTQTIIFSTDVTSKSSTSDTRIDTLTGLKLNEAVIDNSKPDSLTNPSASQSQTLNNTEQPKENVTPATSESKTPDTSITSTENKTIAGAIEKPSVSVEETSPVTDKAAVTSESEDQAITPLDTGATTPVSSEKPVVTTESSASVTGDAGAIVSDTSTPKNPDSGVVTNNNSGAIASELSKSDTPVVTAPATSDPAKTETDVTSTNSEALAPAIEKPSVSVEETSPVTDKAAVTSESEDQAIAPLDTGSTTPVSSEKPVVTTESSSSVTGDEGAIVSDTSTPKNPDSGVVTNNNSVAIASEVSKSDTPVVTTSQNFTFNMGVFKVGETGNVGIDYLFDGGGYEGELGIFNLEGMEKLAQNSDAFITEAARRAVSNSNLGYVVINDATEGARFNGDLPDDINRNQGEYKGVKTLTMLPGDTFAFILVPNRANLQQVANKSATGDDARPLFSLPMANPNGSFMTGQIADVTGIGNTFVMEDLRVDKPGTDSDYNDIIFQVRGATGSAVSIDSVIDLKKDWRPTNLGKALTEYAKPYVTPENPNVGELVTDELLDSVFGNTDNQVDNASKTGAIASEVSKSDTPVVTAPATSDPAKTETEVTSTNSDELAPAIEKPSVSVEETSPVTDETAVTSESENKAIAPLDSGSTTPVSPEQQVVTTESSSSVTGDAGAIVSDTPKNLDSAVVTNNNSGAIASEVSKSDTPVVTPAAATSDPAKTETDVTSTNSDELTSTTQNNNSASNTPPTLGETVANEGGEIGAIAPSTQDNNSKSTTQPTLGETVANEGGEIGAIAPTSADSNSGSIPQPTVVENSASKDEGKGPIASPAQVTITESVVTPQTVVNEWLEQANSQMTKLEASGEQELQSLQNELSDAGNSIYNQVPDIGSNLSSNGNYMNAWVDYLGNQISSSGDSMNAWTNYLQGEVSSIDSSTYNQAWDIWQNLSSNTDYINAWDNYLNNEISGSGQYMYDWAAYTANEINRVSDWMYGWTNHNWNEIVRIENWMIDRTNHVVDEFNQYGVGDAAWNEYDALSNYSDSLVNNAVIDYNNNATDRNTSLNNASRNYRAWNDYRVEVVDNAWSEYNSFDSYTDAVISNAWNDYRDLDNYRVGMINDAWSQYNSMNDYQTGVINDAWNQYYALDNYTDAVMADAWTHYQEQDSTRQQVMSDAWNQYSAITNSWNDSVDDTQAQIDVWAKIATFENRWYNTPDNAKSGLPLIGVIDTGFSAENPDIDYSRITLGKDLVGGDENPLLDSGEWWRNDHGTKILEIIGATRKNNIGIDGINDKSPIWLGGAVDSNDWAQSLIEFVDTAKASRQPNSVVNLSFDLTQTLPDGIVVTRHELTALERAALTYAQQNNVLVVAATGNQNDLMSALSQATKEFDNILVAGAAEGWQRADYSSYGEIDYSNYGKGVDILAQGTASNGAVGSSVAAAKVTGAASLIWAANPNLNYTQVMDILRRTATDLDTPGWDTKTGLGLLNIAAGVHLAKATEPETYKPANFDLFENTLRTYGIPEVYWKDFYNLYYYYDLEAKMTGTVWNSTGSSIATERAAWSWGGAVVGAGIGAVLGDPVTGAVVGGLFGNSGGSGGGSSSNPFPQWARDLTNSTWQSLDSAVTVLDQVAQKTSQAMLNADVYLQQLNSKFASETWNAANYVREKLDDGLNAVGSAATSIDGAVNNGWNSFVNAADYVRNTAAATWNATIATANSVTGWVTDAWNGTNNAVHSVQKSLEKGWIAISKVAEEVANRIPKSIDDIKKQGQEFKELLDKNNPVKKLADDLAAKLKSSLDGIDVGAVLDVLKKIPVVGTVVNGIEGLIALIGGDWKQVVKNAINGVLGIIPGGSAVPDTLVNILVDVGWGIINKDYKTALKDILKELDVKNDVANTFVDVAWAMKDGDWKDVLSAGLSGAGFNNAEKFVDIAWAIKDGDYKKALSTGLSTTGFANADKFVDVAWAVKDGDYKQALSAGLETAGLGNAGTFVGNVFDAITDDYSLPGQSIDPAAIPQKHKLYEYLARGIAYEDPEVSAIAEPAFNNNSLLGNKLAVGEVLNSGYKVDKVISDPSTGFYAVGLVSIDGSQPPVLAVRGTAGSPTERQGIATLKDVLEDANPISIGYSQFQANKNEIEAWLAAQNQQGRRPDVVGHSLGGALAQTIAAEFTDKVGQTVTFNSPGIDDSIALKFAKNKGNPENVTHYVVSGDIVQMAGEAFLPGQAVLSSYSNPFVWKKHGLAVLNGVEIKGEQKASGVKFSSLSVLDLSNPAFQYKELDYTLFLAALGLVSPYVSTSLSTRGTAEANRKAIGAFLNSNFQTIQSWVDAAWSIKDGDYLKALSTGFDVAKFQDGTNWIDMVQSVKEGDYLKALSTGFDVAKFQDGKNWVDMAWSLQQGDYLKALSTGFKVAGFPEGEHLAQAAVNLREGKYLDAFFEGMYMIPGVEDLVNAFKAVGDGNFKGVANSLTKVVTNPTLLKLLVS